MMGALLYREVIVPRLYPVMATRPLDRPRDLWLGVYVNSERVGFVNSRSAPEIREEGAGIKLGLTARLSLDLLGQPTKLLLAGNAWLSNTEGLREFEFTFESGGHTMRIEGEVTGGVLDARLHTAGEEIPVSVPVSRELLLGGSLGMPSLEVPRLEVGETAHIETFDPTTLSVGRAQITCLRKEPVQVAGEAIETWVIESDISGMKTLAWVAEDGEVVRAETPFGFSLRKTTPDEALKPVAPAEEAGLLRTFAVKPEGKQPFRDADLMRVRFTGLDEQHQPPPAPTQRSEQGVYVITRPSPPDTETADRLAESEREQYLRGDAFTPVNHQRIRTAARVAAAGRDSRWDKARGIHDWVYTNIKKVPVMSVPSALEVLEAREGDCNEHTILFVALARAAGIPSRAAVGLVWSDALGAFGYHAWPEVFVGTWVPMDPTFGQHLADATHIKLLDGGIDKWPRLLPYIGRLEIDVLEVR